MPRPWERGRVARIAGRGREACPHAPGTKQARQWLAGWLHSAVKIAERSKSA